MNTSKWAKRWFRIAEEIAAWSKDPSTQVGCVLVRERRQIVAGYNGFPQKLRDDDRYQDRDVKYKLVVHAEANAIAQAAKIGVSVDGCVAFVTYPPCSSCAKLMLQAGVEAVVIPDSDVIVPRRYEEEAFAGARIFHEASIPYNYDPENLTGKSAFI